MIIDITGVIVPEGWEKQLLKQCLEKLKSGKYVERGWSPQCLSHPAENTWGVLKTTSVQMGEYLPEYNKELPKTLEPKVGLEVNDGDFLVTTTGPRNRCGVVCHVRTTPKKLIFSGKILRFRADENQLLPAYLMYLLMSPSYQKVLDKLKVGTSDSSVSIGNQQILDLEIPVAAINEQKRIVEILEEQFSHLDAALASVHAVREKAARLRRSLLKAAFTGTLTGHDATIGVPRGWKSTKLGDCVQFSPKIPKESLDESVTVSFVPMAKVMEVTGRVELDESISANEGTRRNLTYFEDGDVIFAKITPCMENGKVARPVGLVNGAAFGSTEFHVLRPSTDIIGEYLRLLLVHDDFRRDAERAMTGAVGQRRVPRKYLELYELALPTIKEQIQIVAILDEQLSRIDATLEVVDEIERKSSALRRSILHAAFTGELTKERREDANV